MNCVDKLALLRRAVILAVNVQDGITAEAVAMNFSAVSKRTTEIRRGVGMTARIVQAACLDVVSRSRPNSRTQVSFAGNAASTCAVKTNAKQTISAIKNFLIKRFLNSVKDFVQ